MKRRSKAKSKPKKNNTFVPIILLLLVVLALVFFKYFLSNKGIFKNTGESEQQGMYQVGGCDGPGWATRVAYVKQGLRKDGSAVPADRSNSANALGSSNNVGFSLGMGGEIILEYNQYITNGNDFDIVAQELTSTDRQTNSEEKAEVYGSDVYPFPTNIFSGKGYLIGTLSSKHFSDGKSYLNTRYTSVVPGKPFKYLRIVDKTDPAISVATEDGYDLDSVKINFGRCSAVTATATPTRIANCSQYNNGLFPANREFVGVIANRKDGRPVNPERRDEGYGVGTPGFSNIVRDGYVKSLGYGGYGMYTNIDPRGGIRDLSGPEIEIYDYEDSWRSVSTYPEEKAEVFATQSGWYDANKIWVSLGTISSRAPGYNGVFRFDLANTQFRGTYVKMFKVVDRTNRNLHTWDSDGWDVDAVKVRYSCPQ